MCQDQKRTGQGSRGDSSTWPGENDKVLSRDFGKRGRSDKLEKPEGTKFLSFFIFLRFQILPGPSIPNPPPVRTTMLHRRY